MDFTCSIELASDFHRASSNYSCDFLFYLQKKRVFTKIIFFLMKSHLINLFISRIFKNFPVRDIATVFFALINYNLSTWVLKHFISTQRSVNFYTVTVIQNFWDKKKKSHLKLRNELAWDWYTGINLEGPPFLKHK